MHYVKKTKNYSQKKPEGLNSKGGTLNLSQKVCEPPLYSSRIISTYIKLIRSKYNYINLGDLLSYAGMESYQVEDEEHWFTQGQVDLFYERLVKITRNNDISREAGRYAASPESLGMMRQYILGFVGPAKAYELIGKAATNFTKSSFYKSRKIDSNKVEITVTPKEGVSEKPFQCENRLGYFEAISTIFNFKLPKIEHTECIFKGGRNCRYIVSWKESVTAFWKKIRNYAALFLIATGPGLSLIYPWATLTIILPLVFLVIMLLSWYAGTVEIRELNIAVNNLRGSSDKLLGQISVNYNNFLMINEIGQALSMKTNIDDILKKSIEILESRLDYDRGIILLPNPDKTRLIFSTGFGYTGEELRLLKKKGFHLDRPRSKGVFVISFREQKPILVNDINEIKETLSSHSLQLAKKLGVKSFICCPLVYEEESLGILAVDNIITKRPLIQSDINILMGIAPEMAISIHDTMLFEAKELQFKSILQALAASIDARDPMTAGHSEKVTEYAVGICHELGLSKDFCEMIRVASLLHDYGKIGVEDTILKKAGRLKAEEYKKIKTHAVKTREILEQINFEGIYRTVPEIAGSHHEKMDGSGYPRGIKGEEIPLGAKIIAVADFFDATTSKRHYRDPMPLDVAVSLLQEKIGIHFEKKVVEALISYYNRKYNIKPLKLVSEIQVN